MAYVRRHVPGAMQIEGTSLPPPHTLRAGILRPRLRLAPQAKETEDQRLKGNSSAVRAFFPRVAPHPRFLPGEVAVFGGTLSTESWGQSSFLQSPQP